MNVVVKPAYRAIAIGIVAAALLVGAFLLGSARPARSAGALTTGATSADRASQAVLTASGAGGRITVTGTGTVTGTPNQLVLSMGVQTSASSVSTALIEANHAARRVMGALQSDGVRKADIQTSGLSIQPNYSNGNPAPVGYGVSEQLTGLIETNADHELVFTLLRSGYASPKIRYNLRDVGGVIAHRAMMRVLAKHGVDVAALPRSLAFPFLFVGGRSDLTVGFYGAKVFTSDLDAVITGEAELRERIHSFQMRVTHDAEHSECLNIALERADSDAAPVDLAEVHAAVVRGLKRVNQDFREVSKMFSDDKVVIELHAFMTGPFANRDIRVKNRYLG